MPDPRRRPARLGVRDCVTTQFANWQRAHCCSAAPMTLALLWLIQLQNSQPHAALLPSAPIEAGGFATTATPRCPGSSLGSRRRPDTVLWNVLYAEVPGLSGPGTGRSEGTNLSSIAGATSQVALCAYDDGSLGGGYSTPPFGTWPVCNAPPACHNGGIPQAVNLTAHALALEEAVDILIPDRNTRGILALDYEGWQPVWDDLLGPQYKNMSEHLVSDAHPGWSAAQVTEQAEAEFNSAARAFYEVTFTTLRALRPHMQLSHHAFPVTVCYDQPLMREHNDRMQWLYELFDVLSPSIYLQPLTSYVCAEDQATLIRQTMSEATRMAKACAQRKRGDGRPTPVIPFTWFRREFPGNNSILNEAAFRTEMLVPFEFPYTAAIRVWGSEAFAWPGNDATDGGNCSTSADPQGCDVHLNGMMRAFGAKILDDFVRRQCRCAESQCRGHGRCYANETRCYCDAGFTGANCSDATRIREPQWQNWVGPVDPSGATGNEEMVLCPDGLASCKYGQTCAQTVLGPWVCCPYANATICDSRRCCPHAHECVFGGAQCVAIRR